MAAQDITQLIQGNELVAIRTLLHLKALHAIPATGSISLSELSKATQAEESLLGKLPA